MRHKKYKKADKKAFFLFSRVSRVMSCLRSCRIQRKPFPKAAKDALRTLMLASIPKRVARIPRKFWPLVFPKLVVQREHPLNNMQKAKRNVSLMSRAEIEDKMEIAELALKQAYAGNLSFASYVMLRTCYTYSEELERTSTVKGLAPLIEPALAALDAINDRCMGATPVWVAKPCRGPELQALGDMVSAHRFQLENCTIKELKNAATRLTRQITGGKLYDASGEFDLEGELTQLRKETKNRSAVYDRLSFE